MKSTSLVLALLLAGCTVQDPSKAADKPTDTTTTKVPQEVKPGSKPNEGICSFSNDLNKGCLKAVIAGSNLSVGDFQFDLGVIAFVRSFDKQLTSSNYFGLPAGESVAFSNATTVNNFFYNFGVTVEGSNTTYSAISTGLGNLQVNNMTVGTYNVVVSKQFDLKVLNATNQTIGHKCVVIWSNQGVDIVAGTETPLAHPIGQFNLSTFDESCSGSAVTNVYPASNSSGTTVSSGTTANSSGTTANSSGTLTTTASSSTSTIVNTSGTSSGTNSN